MIALNKNKAYCPICNEELSFNEKEQIYKYNCNCYENKRFNYILAWCDKCKKFTQRRGLIVNKCNRCAVIAQHKTMKKQDPEGYAKRQAAATVKANEKMKAEGKGVWSNEQHIIAEKTKIKNGTSLSNQEFRKKIGCNGGLWAKNLTKDEKKKYYNKLLDNGFSRPSSFKTENNTLLYYDKSIKQYIPWETYKSKFNRKRITMDIKIFINNVKSLDIFKPKNMGPIDSYNLNDIIKIYSTFREQNSDSWEGKRSAFEQSLVENKVYWFAYVKFYIDTKNRIRPLVVGKSGSLNVNSNGSDINFSEDKNHGPARLFLNDENTHWDKTQILIIKAKSEKQALYYEWYIANYFNLFES